MTGVDICVCTFQRASVTETLASLMTLDVPAGTAVRVIVVDNDVAPSAQARVAPIPIPPVAIFPAPAMPAWSGHLGGLVPSS